MDTPRAPGEQEPGEAGRPRRYGRRLFIATVAGGLSSLYWGKAAWSPLSHALSGVEAAVPLVPTGGWRIYTISGHMPAFDPATWRLKIGGLVEQPVSLGYDELRALPAWTRSRPSTASRAGRCRTSTGVACACRTSSIARVLSPPGMR